MAHRIMGQNEDFLTLARQITHLSKRMQDIENKMHGISGGMQSFSKLGEHAAQCKPNEMKSEIQSMKADLLDLAHKVEAMRSGLATGRATILGSAKLTKEDYASMREAKIADTPLGEIAETYPAIRGREVEQFETHKRASLIEFGNNSRSLFALT